MTGGAIGGIGPAIGAATGLGTTAGDVLAGGLGGTVGAELTHQNPLLGAAGGALGGLATGVLAGGAPAGPSAAPGGISSGVAAPPPVGTDAGADVGGVPAALTSPATTTAIGAAPVTPLDTSGVSVTQPDLTGFSAPSDVSTQPPGVVGTGAAGSNIGVPNLTPTDATAAVTAAPTDVSAPTGLVGQAAAPFTSDTGTTLNLSGDATSLGGQLADATAQAAPAAAKTGVGGFLKSAAPFLPLAGLALDALNKPKTPYSGILGSEAGALSQQGAQLRGYLENGTLPPGQSEALTSAADAANATIASEYASRGMTASSAEAQDQQAVQDRKVAAAAQIATQLFSQGVQETNMADSLYIQLMNVQLNQDAQLNQAFGNFATALAGMGRPLYANPNG